LAGESAPHVNRDSTPSHNSQLWEYNANFLASRLHLNTALTPCLPDNAWVDRRAFLWPPLLLLLLLLLLVFLASSNRLAMSAY